MGKPTSAPPPIKPLGANSPPRRVTRRPDWPYWGQIPKAEIWALVALSCDMEPRDYQSPYSQSITGKAHPEGQLFTDRLQIAIANLTGNRPSGAMGNSSEEFGAARFAKWALSRWSDLPAGFAKLAENESSFMPAKFESWKVRRLWTVRDAVYLLCGFEPTQDQTPFPPRRPFFSEEEARLEVIYSHMKAAIDLEQLPTLLGRVAPGQHPAAYRNQLVEPAKLVAWAPTIGWEVPMQLRDVVALEPVVQAKPESPLSPKAESNYLRVIGALLEVINGETVEKRHPSFKDEAALIRHLALKYEGIGGLSDSHLTRLFPKAKRTIKES